MCVIVYKPATTPIDKFDLLNMWKQNPDGAGICYRVTADNQPVVCIERGFMTYKSLRKRVKRLQDVELALHFRKKTHGKIEPIMTHPFPLLPIDAPEHKQTQIAVSVAFMHNGVINAFGSEEVSDTYELASTVLCHLPKPTRRKLLTALTGKFLTMDTEETFMYGHFEEYKGLKCSNTHFKPYVKTVYPAQAWTGTTNHNSHNNVGFTSDYYSDHHSKPYEPFDYEEWKKNNERLNRLHDDAIAASIQKRQEDEEKERKRKELIKKKDRQLQLEEWEEYWLKHNVFDM